MFPGNPPPEFRLFVPGLAYPLDKRHLARRSARISRMLEDHHGLLPRDLPDAPPSPTAIDLAAKFCYGLSPDLSPENILAVICVASFLEMTEEHSPNNLLHQALSFFSSAVLPHWNSSLRCLRAATAAILPSAATLNLVNPLLNSISAKALHDPLLLSTPLDDTPETQKPKSLIFDHWCAEDITDLPLELFLMAVNAVKAVNASPAAVAGCIYRYARRQAHVGTSTQSEEYEKNSHKRILEALEPHLPRQRSSLKVKPLLQMLQSAMALGANSQCRTGLEQRIGSLLSEASVEDLLVPSHGYARETKYDVDCVERVVAHFRGSSGEMKKVAVLLEGYLAEVAAERELRKEKFSRLLKMLSWLLESAEEKGDGVYRAVDLYFLSHGELTESEREEICRGALDCRRLSPEVCERAAQNERMPLRVVAQVLYVGQMHIREVIAGVIKEEEEEEEEEEEGSEGGVGKEEGEEEGGGGEEIGGECVGCGGRKVKKKKGLGFWRMLGCRDVRVACACGRRKVHLGD